MIGGRLGFEYAIAGLGVTRQGRDLGIPERELRREAIELALADAGLPRSAVDGYVFTVENSEDLRYLGLSPRFCWALHTGGATALASLQVALGAIATGQAETVACVYAMAPRQRFGALGVGGFSYGYGQLYGLMGPASYHALHARRHMHRYGTTSEQLGAVAVTQRRYASVRPEALGYERPVTLEDHQRSRMIVDPLRLLDCCRDTDGGVAIIVTRGAQARDLSGIPVYVLGLGFGHNIRNWHAGDPFDHHDDIAPAAELAFSQAGLSLDDVDVAQLYDPFTISVLMQLEHYGFCKPGEGGDFVAEGQTGPEGTIPTNTGGGQLSAFYATGYTPLVEAIWQLRGAAGAGQLPEVEVALVSGHGANAGVPNTWAHGTLLLGSAP